jgi:AcrR family transcriptional regulator
VTSGKKENPQKELSRNWLAQALLDLMREKPYRKITITELTIRAKLTRRTFYRHFVMLDDILNYIIQQRADDFLSYLIGRGHLDLSSLIRDYISYWEQHKEFLALLRKNNLMYLLFEKAFPQVSKKYTYQFYKKLPDNTDMEIESDIFDRIFFFVMGGSWLLTDKWLAEDGKFSMEEIVALVESYWKS